MVLGEKLSKLRKIKKLSHEQLALELDISKTAIINWESNKSKPSSVNLLKICDFYETDIYTLLEDVDNVNFSYAQFKGSNYVVNPKESTINFNNSPELIQSLIDNQSKISTLLVQQNQLLEKIISKK